MNLNASPLLKVAKEAYERCSKQFTERQHAGSDPLIAIVFATAAMEGFINEVFELASEPGDLLRLLGDPPEHKSVAALAGLAKALEQASSPIPLKFMLAKIALSGEPYDKGSPPYQDFELLIKVRNCLVHLRPLDKFKMPGNNDVTGKPTPRVAVPRFMKGLRTKNVLVETDATTFPNSFYEICTPAMARWACNTASAMVQSIVQIVPDNGSPMCLRKKMDLFYGQYYQPVD